MMKTNNGRPKLNGGFLFFREFLKHPLQIGSIVPSSRYLEQRILERCRIATAGTVVELGAGTGGTTRAILRAMPRDATLLSIEVNDRFHRALNQIQDDRLIAHQGRAEELENILQTYGLDTPDVVVSGIPFSTMSPEHGSRVLATVADNLAPKGRFVAYQVSRRVARLSRPHFGRARAAVEWRNLPPMRVFHWEKKLDEESA
ncbi:class I SAM-dependent methyltransferase [Nitrospina sp. P1_D6]|uniref:class I SAM-dependent methyltransferase n=2 Tax=unclassified Nitrospina TaxID=2638683 RepID=UPI003F9DE549